MGVNAVVKNPGEIECTLELTMKLREWKQIRRTLSTKAEYVELKIIKEIDGVIAQLEQVFYSDINAAIVD